jgi:hypothetical protein
VRIRAPAALIAIRYSSLLGRSLLLVLGEREALRLFPASCAFLSVVSAFAVSHKPQPSPASRAVAIRRRIQRLFQS